MKTPETIVVIDDNLNDIQLLRRVLERTGYTVHQASSGDEGLEVIRRTMPHCVVVDYRMPGMNGYELSREVKSDPALQSIPILMLTGADSARNQVEGLDAGADDFVTKGSDIDVILARVRALLRVKAYQDRMLEQAEQLRRLYEEVTQKSEKIMALNMRLNKDLSFARRVQEALLPDRAASIAGAEIRSAYIPSETLSGDFYDYFLHQDSLYLFLADVSGHGLPAAILVSLLKSFLHSEVDSDSTLAEFMARLNDFLVSASLPSQFATAQLLRFNPQDRTLVYSNAAHPPFLLLRQQEKRATPYEQPGHLLGAQPSMKFEEHTVTLDRGDLLFAYTDGLTDRRTPAGDFYSLDRVAALLEANRDEDVSALYERVYADVSGFAATDEFRDDIAFVLTRFT